MQKVAKGDDTGNTRACLLCDDGEDPDVICAACLDRLPKHCQCGATVAPRRPFGLCDGCIEQLTRPIYAPPAPPTPWPARDARHELARVAFAALEGDALAAASGESSEGLRRAAYTFACRALDARASALANVRTQFGPKPSRWPGRWRRIRALRLAWALGSLAHRAAFGFPPNPTAALLREVEDFAGREAACALRHPEVIGGEGAMDARASVRIAHLCAVLATAAASEAATAPSYIYQRAEDQGALRDAVEDLLHAAAPLAAAGDAAAALAADLAAALKKHLAVAGQRDDAAEHPKFLALLQSDLPKVPDEFRASLGALADNRTERLRPFVDAADPFSDVNIGTDWRPSAQPESHWLNGWRQSLAAALPATSTPSELAPGAALVMLADLRGWGPGKHPETFSDALGSVFDAQPEAHDDPRTSAILTALRILGYDPTLFIVAEKVGAQRQRKAEEIRELRTSNPAEFRRRVREAVATNEGVNGRAAQSLGILVNELRDWVEKDPTHGRRATWKPRAHGKR